MFKASKKFFAGSAALLTVSSSLVMPSSAFANDQLKLDSFINEAEENLTEIEEANVDNEEENLVELGQIEEDGFPSGEEKNIMIVEAVKNEPQTADSSDKEKKSFPWLLFFGATYCLCIFIENRDILAPLVEMFIQKMYEKVSQCCERIVEKTRQIKNNFVNRNTENNNMIELQALNQENSSEV